MQAAPEKPLSGPSAFIAVDDESAQAQAAILLCLASQLRGDRQKMQARSAAVAHPTDTLLADDLSDFPIPRIAPASKRYPREMLEGEVRSRHAASMSEASQTPETLAKLADDVYKHRTTESAAALACAALWNPHPLVRVAAANAVLPVMAEATEAVVVLAEHASHSDDLVREVAATTLARYMPEHPALQSLVASEEPPPATTPSDTSMLIHGTWARKNAWHQPPNGDFWKYIKTGVWPDLYDQSDFYRWSGGYSDGARALAGDQLVTWIATRNENGISLITHSHGGNVAMLASWRGVTFDRLILLSGPVHPAKYSVNFNAVQRVVSIRVRLDLVLLADGSGARFTDPRYNENVLPIWFNHSASHDPKVWVKYNVPGML